MSNWVLSRINLGNSFARQIQPGTHYHGVTCQFLHEPDQDRDSGLTTPELP